jgi:hypothetical protein
MMRPRLIVIAIVAALAAFGALTYAQTPDSTVAVRTKGANAFRGTWTGRSICVGNNRPACKDETVVYRFVPFTGAPWQLRCLADKIIEGKRVPMGALMFQYDDKAHLLRCEFKKGNTHGMWSYAVAGDSLTGDLVTLPGGDKGRDVRAVRVTDESKLPAAPSLKEYEE